MMRSGREGSRGGLTSSGGSEKSGVRFERAHAGPAAPGAEGTQPDKGRSFVRCSSPRNVAAGNLARSSLEVRARTLLREDGRHAS